MKKETFYVTKNKLIKYKIINVVFLILINFLFFLSWQNQIINPVLLYLKNY